MYISRQEIPKNGSSDTKWSFTHRRKTAGRGKKLTGSRRTKRTIDVQARQCVDQLMAISYISLRRLPALYAVIVFPSLRLIGSLAGLVSV